MRKTILTAIIVFIASAVFAQAQVKSSENSSVNYTQAIDNLSKLIENPNMNKVQLAQLYFNRAECYRFSNQFALAYKDYTSTIKLDASYKFAYWNRGIANEALNNLKAAISDYKKALTMILPTDSANNAILYCNIAYNEFRLRDSINALNDDSTAIKYNPAYGRAYYLRGGFYSQLKDYKSAINDISHAIRLYNNYNNTKLLSLWYTSLADVKRYNKQYKEAINNYSFALKLDPDNRIAYWNRAAAYHMHKDYELAANDYSKAMTYYTGDNTELSKLYDDRAINELGQSHLTQAIQDDSVAIALNLENKSAYLNQAEGYTQNGEYQKGIDMLNRVINFAGDNKKFKSFLYYEIANNHYFLNQFDKVVEDCTTAITLNPADGSAYYYRAKVYLKKFDKKELAITDFNKVIELDTSHKTVSYIFSLFYIGKGDEATGILQREVVNTTDEPVLLSDYYNLACLYSLMNKPEEANNYLKMAIDKGYAKKYAVADEDLDNIRNTADYKTIMGDGK
jgi:tetratricopeptide (TPR) repeat protein